MPFTLPEPNRSFDLTMDDGAVIRIRRHGNPDGVRLFISHGNGFAIDGYLPFWGPLRERFDLILFDFRNHGLNPRIVGDGHNYNRMSRDLELIYLGVSQELGKRTSVGVFHSMSGRTAMKHAVEIGWCWDALVLFDPPNLPPADHWHHETMCAFERRLVDFAINRPERFKDPMELASNYAENRGHARWVDGAHELMARAVLRRDEDSDEWVLSCQREMEALIYLEAMTMDLWPRYEEYGGPVKLIGADPDLERPGPTAIANKALAEEGGYVYEAIPGAGHMLQIEAPEACRRAMLSFFEDLGLI